jgi:predicted RNA polymerase sigma factor
MMPSGWPSGGASMPDQAEAWGLLALLTFLSSRTQMRFDVEIGERCWRIKFAARWDDVLAGSSAVKQLVSNSARARFDYDTNVAFTLSDEVLPKSLHS